MSNPEIPPIPSPGSAGPFPAIDDRAVRRAMRRGVIRTGLVAAVGLVVLAMLVVATAAVISTVRGPRFHLVAVNGMVVAHPEYEIWQDGSCCASGPLFGLTNLGLVNQVRLGLRPLGSLNHPGPVSVVVEQGAGGDLHTNLDAGPTPLGDALARGRPNRASTAQFLRELPAAHRGRRHDPWFRRAPDAAGSGPRPARRPVRAQPQRARRRLRPGPADPVSGTGRWGLSRRCPGSRTGSGPRRR